MRFARVSEARARLSSASQRRIEDRGAGARHPEQLEKEDRPLRQGGTEESGMRVGILGSGLMGGKLGTIFARAGHEVVFSYSRSEKKLAALARDAGVYARVGTPSDAARDADAILLAVHWSR